MQVQTIIIRISISLSPLYSSLENQGHNKNVMNVNNCILKQFPRKKQSSCLFLYHKFKKF